VRSTAADAWKADGELKLAAVGGPLVPARKGNFAAQTYSLTNTGTETDIVRITLGGKLAETVYLDEGGLYPASTKEQNAVILNNLYAIGPGETIEFDVFVKSETGLVSDYDLTVTATSETNGDKAASAGLNILTNATATAKNFISIVETGKNSRVWVLSFTVVETYLDGTSAVVPYSVRINANNANIDGKYDLGAYTLIYDIKGNGSNIKEFRIVTN